MVKIYLFYADVYLLQNFLMDYIALLGVNSFLHRGKSIVRIFFVALAASFFGLLLIVQVKNQDLRVVITHFILNTFLILIAFGMGRYKEFIENWAIMYLVTILLGGVMEWEKSNQVLAHSYLLQGILAAVFLTAVSFYMERYQSFKNKIFPAEMDSGEQKMTIKAFWDSGNQLYDPYTGLPVSIVSEKTAKKLFGETAEKFYYIPYCAVGTSQGVIPVKKLEKLVIDRNGKKVEIEPAEIAITDNTLFLKKEYDMILQASLLEK